MPAAITTDPFSVLINRTRRRMLAAIAAGHNTPYQLMQELNLRQPVTSKHLKYLRSAGLIDVETRGCQTVYTTNQEAIDGMIHQMSAWR